MVYGDRKYISIQMYMPRAISERKKNLVALDNADSLLSSQVLGFSALKPLGQTDCVDPPVVKYSVAAAAGLAILDDAAKPRTLVLERAWNMVFSL